MIAAFRKKHKLSDAFEKTAKNWYIPLAESIKKHHDGANTPFYVAINGCQGSGKSTLSAFLKAYLISEYDLNVVSLSLDDFYYSKSERMALAIKVHPLFKIRGVPGTHNMKLAKTVLEKLANGERTILPLFDKSTDNPFPEATWPTINRRVDIVLFEGWCWGVRHQLNSELQKYVNPLEQEEDALGVWRQYVNKQLQNVYEPLYSIMNYWVMLKAPNFEIVYRWRLEQEQQLSKNVHGQGKAIMNESQLSDFIHYFQRLTEYGLKTLPEKCDLVYELDDMRRITKCVRRE